MDNKDTVTFKGKTYSLDTQAEPTSRLFDGGFQSAKEGETYTDEWGAYATGPDGEQVMIVWQWQMVKGQEPEDGGDYPWLDSNIVAARPQ
jgi:hypothetical protein